MLLLSALLLHFDSHSTRVCHQLTILLLQFLGFDAFRLNHFVLVLEQFVCKVKICDISIDFKQLKCFIDLVKLVLNAHLFMLYWPSQLFCVIRTTQISTCIDDDFGLSLVCIDQLLPILCLLDLVDSLHLQQE